MCDHGRHLRIDNEIVALIGYTHHQKSFLARESNDRLAAKDNAGLRTRKSREYEAGNKSYRDQTAHYFAAHKQIRIERRRVYIAVALPHHGMDAEEECVGN